MLVCNVEELIEHSCDFTIGICYRHTDWAQFIFDLLVKHFKELDCLQRVYIDDGNGYIYLVNGVKYIILNVNCALGYRFDRVYVEQNIDDNDIDNIVYPTILAGGVYKVV